MEQLHGRLFQKLQLSFLGRLYILYPSSLTYVVVNHYVPFVDAEQDRQ